MPLNNLRIDSLVPNVGQLLVDEIIKYDKSAKYYLQEETAEESGKLHWQGWCSYSRCAIMRKNGIMKPPEDSFREHFNRWTQKLSEHYKSSETKSFPKTKDIMHQKSYILNNDRKKDIPVLTNFTSDEIAVFKYEAPIWVPRAKNSKRCRSDDWWTITYRELRDYVIFKNIYGEKVINYPQIPKFVLKRVAKNLDDIILRRLILGLTNQLEVEFDHPSNKRLETSFISDFLGTYSLIFDMNNFENIKKKK